MYSSWLFDSISPLDCPYLNAVLRLTCFFLTVNKRLNCLMSTKIYKRWSKSCCWVYFGCLGVPFTDWLIVLCILSLHSSLVYPFSPSCVPFILMSGAVICLVSRTRYPLFIPQLADNGIKRGRLQMYGTCYRVSGAAERMCPVWQDPQIYSVDVTLHLWDRWKDFLVPFFFPHKHPPCPESSPPLPFILFLSPILYAMLICWPGSGSLCEKKGVAVWIWVCGKSRKVFCWSLWGLSVW